MSAKSKARKSWREKLADSKGLPKVEEITGKMSARWGTGTFVIPAPLEVDEIMRRVPFGQLTTINQIWEAIARRHSATIGCPITTGIFTWVAAHAAEEAAAEGEQDITPYWRTLKSSGELNEKYPGGVDAQLSRLEQEGHTIAASRGGKTLRVKGYERFLAEL